MDLGVIGIRLFLRINTVILYVLLKLLLTYSYTSVYNRVFNNINQGNDAGISPNNDHSNRSNTSWISRLPR